MICGNEITMWGRSKNKSQIFDIDLRFLYFHGVNHHQWNSESISSTPCAEYSRVNEIHLQSLFTMHNWKTIDIEYINFQPLCNYVLYVIGFRLVMRYCNVHCFFFSEFIRMWEKNWMMAKILYYSVYWPRSCCRSVFFLQSTVYTFYFLSVCSSIFCSLHLIFWSLIFYLFIRLYFLTFHETAHSTFWLIFIFNY